MVAQEKGIKPGCEEFQQAVMIVVEEISRLTDSPVEEFIEIDTGKFSPDLPEIKRNIIEKCARNLAGFTDTDEEVITRDVLIDFSKGDLDDYEEHINALIASGTFENRACATEYLQLFLHYGGSLDWILTLRNLNDLDTS